MPTHNRFDNDLRNFDLPYGIQPRRRTINQLDRSTVCDNLQSFFSLRIQRVCIRRPKQKSPERQYLYSIVSCVFAFVTFMRNKYVVIFLIASLLFLFYLNWLIFCDSSESMNTFKSLWLWFLTLLMGPCWVSGSTDTPVIGVVVLDLAPRLLKYWPAHSSILVASYVKAIESSGARAVPIALRKNETYYRDVLNKVNGIVLPGGESEMGPGHPYYDAVKIVYRIAKEINDNGKVFPILGVCLGYEFMIIAANNDEDILDQCHIYTENYPVKFFKPPQDTKFFSRLTTHQKKVLETEDVTYHWHIYCAELEDFNNAPLLNENWVVTSTVITSAGYEFVNCVEHVKYPFYGVQFHPEKVAYEWTKPTMPHSEKAIHVNRYFYDQLVHVARRNDNHFDDIVDEEAALVYTNAVTDMRNKSSYEEAYLF